MTEVPHGRWAMAGECAFAWVRRPRARPPLPSGISALPLVPAAFGVVRWTATPVGPYDEVSVAEPARIGVRPGFCVTAQGVSTPAARLAARSGWGVPAEVGRIGWAVEDGVIEVVWDDRDLRVVVRPMGPSVPALAFPRSVQRTGDGPAVIPRRMWCLMQLASFEISVPPDDELAWVAGRHPGALLRHMRAVVSPARPRSRGARIAPAPLAGPEPALLLDRAAVAGEPLECNGPGRLAQLVRAQPSHG